MSNIMVNPEPNCTRLCKITKLTSFNYRLHISNVPNELEWHNKFIKIMNIEVVNNKKNCQPGNNSNKIHNHYFMLDNVVLDARAQGQ